MSKVGRIVFNKQADEVAEKLLTKEWYLERKTLLPESPEMLNETRIRLIEDDIAELRKEIQAIKERLEKAYA